MRYNRCSPPQYFCTLQSSEVQKPQTCDLKISLTPPRFHDSGGRVFCRPEKHVSDLVRHGMPQQGGEVNFTRFLKPFYPITKDHGADPDLGVWQGISQRAREIVGRDT
jgi:hypothetical protein